MGSGDLTAEFDALFELSVSIEPDTLIEISVPIFGRLATQNIRSSPLARFLFLKSGEHCSRCFVPARTKTERTRYQIVDGRRDPHPRTPRCTSDPVLVTE